MPPSRGGRTVYGLGHDSRKGTKMEKKSGAPLLLWGGIAAAAVLAIVLVLAVWFWPRGSVPNLTEEERRQEQEKMIQQVHQMQGKRK